MLRATGNERATLAVATGSRPRIGRQVEYPLDSIADPRVCLGPFGREVGLVYCAALFDQVDNDDLELFGRPLLCAYQRDAHVDGIEQLRVAPPADEDFSQLKATVVELGCESGARRELDAEIGERGAEVEADDARRRVAEHVEIAALRRPVERALFGLELGRLDERLGPRWARLRLREPSVLLDAIRDREAHVRGLIRAPLPAVHLAREPPPAHVVRPAQMRRSDLRQILIVHTDDASCVLRQLTGTGGHAGYTRRVRIAIGGDHAGYPLKQHLLGVLKEWRHDVDDLGTHSEDPVDYPIYCAAVGRAVTRGDAEVGIVLGGSGQGEQISANKVRGVRAALCNDLYTARMARAHNNANVLSIGARIVAAELADEIARVFLSTPFDGGRHVRRIAEIAAIENEEAGR
jgi:ribose 5-phosphate isomerase B